MDQKTICGPVWGIQIRWLSTRDFRQVTGCKKLSPCYMGPYRVLKRINLVTYWLEIHVFTLHSIFPSWNLWFQILWQMMFVRPNPPAPLEIDGKTVYTMSQILRYHRRKFVWLTFAWICTLTLLYDYVPLFGIRLNTSHAAYASSSVFLPWQ